MQKTCATSGGALAHIRALYRDPCAAAGSCTSWWHRRDCVRMHKRVQTPARKHAHAHGSQLMNVRGYCDTQSLSPARTRAGQHYGAVFSVLAGLGTGAVRLPLATNNAPAAAATATTTCQGFRGDQRKMRTRCQSGAWPLVRDRESVHVARRHSSRRAWGVAHHQDGRARSAGCCGGGRERHQGLRRFALEPLHLAGRSRTSRATSAGRANSAGAAASVASTHARAPWRRPRLPSPARGRCRG